MPDVVLVAIHGRVCPCSSSLRPDRVPSLPASSTPWLDVPGVRERLEWLSAVGGVDLIEHGTVSDADTIRDTAIAQPLHGRCRPGDPARDCSRTRPRRRIRIGAGAGHTVGEITAAVGAGVLTAEQAMVFVRERGEAMAEASAAIATGMSAVLGGDPEEIVARCDRTRTRLPPT